MTAPARPITFTLGGVILTPISIMVRAKSEGPQADRLSTALAEALGEAGWYEADFTRNIWYLNVVHFAGPLVDAAALVEWVQARRDLDLGTTTSARVDLARWDFTSGGAPIPTCLASASLT